ncbi:MAG: M23 family metallopeptidase [Deltaproteobacteria bacterium]|nr:M23 family metallopeptidase [Deltaproteobacteria bacterium]
MDRRFLTFFILTNDASKTRQLRIPISLLKGAGVFALLSIVIFSFIIMDYARIKREKAELFSLKKENADQKSELEGFGAKIREIEAQIARLNIFDIKLRKMANLTNPKGASPDQVMGMGGPEEDAGINSTAGKTAALKENIKGELTRLTETVKAQEASFSELHEFLLKRSSFLAATPSIWPARGWVTSNYGERLSPFTGAVQVHKGLDIANRIGTTVVAPADGIVVEVVKDKGLGKKVTLFHGFGFKTSYGHLSEVMVKVGEKVKRGTKIALMGNTGHSTGPHLHYEISLNGVAVNPAKYILN